MGVIGSAKLLQALARDNLLPGFSLFGQGTKGNDEPTYAILFTFVVAQLTLLCDINQIASFVTMTYLMTFLVTQMSSNNRARTLTAGRSQTWRVSCSRLAPHPTSVLRSTSSTGEPHCLEQ